ncbi:hypothetical protein [Breznakiella homolactica]|uniref:TIGR03545 family protein n=1 Tax=Breznakiella homolactica TaxID=2798577 RepID=A0A7T7XQA7_9SPIR|nr:hypothetical protein [Breznakiella homolactica]QQO10417.1 hypothetical protein JFL75_05725 [Breznakiella homolactica]
MAEKKEKIPGMFRKPIPEKRFEKRLLKYIEQPAEKKFFRSCFELRDGRYHIVSGLDGKAQKRLKVLAKAIRTNRKMTVRILPLVFAVVLVAAIGIFITVFMNPLIESGIEKGMETIFEARVDVDRFNLNLRRLQVSIGSITVANRDKPMQNLFQIGRMEFRLNPAAIFRGKVYIEEIRADSLQFGTARRVSGALPAYKAKEQQPKEPKAELPPLIDLQNFDAQALIDREYAKLMTPKAYDAAEEAINTAIDKWQGQVANIENRTEELQDTARPVMAINIKELTTPEAITGAIRDITALVKSVQGAVDDVTAVVEGVQEDVETVKYLEQLARNSVTGDIDHLKSYLDFGSGAALNALEPSIKEILTDTAEEYIAYGIRALEVLEKIKALSESLPKQEAKKNQPPTFRGRDVAFPSAEYPRFFLGILASDFTINDWRWGFDLRGVSSDPDLSKQPVVLDLGVSELADGGKVLRDFAFLGSADFRSSAPELFSVDFTGSGFAVKIGDYLKDAGIGGFTGNAAFSLDFYGTRTGGMGGGGDIAITQAALVDPAGTLAEAMDEAIRSVEKVALQIGYDRLPEGDDDFTLSTNLGELVLDILKRTAERYARQAAAEIERVVREYVSAHLEGKLLSGEQLDLLFDIAKGDQNALNQLQNTLEEKQRELERRIQGAVDEVQQQIEDAALQVQNQAEAAAAEAKRQAEEAQRQAEAAAEAARRQAEEAAAQAAAEIKRQAEEAAAEAKRQAEEAAREAAQKALEDAAKKSGIPRLPF